ncbi:MAG TPA: molybdopterin cofactor-binding domain-containing protein, partial [Myxococcaceae bacterium]|nr:molybdopterin cofactor-binding domain-containing protein [Myxococcaceae bacterium]
MSTLLNVSRRQFLQASVVGGAGLILGVSYRPARAAGASRFQPNAFLAIDRTGRVTIWVAKSEMGQGVRTALPMIVADELEADWEQVRVEQALAEPKYGRMGTGGSSSVRTTYEPLRKAGAAAREMLVAAAAAQWKVEPSSCRAERGAVLHPASGRRAGYGELVSAAAELPVPGDPKLKDPALFRYIGKPMPRVDIPAKVNGSAVFGIDVRLPKMLTATIARCPVFGGKPARVDDRAARAVPGVRRVVTIDAGVAVVAEATWPALRGRDALQITWDEGPNGGLGQERIWGELRQAVSKPGATGRQRGDAAGTLAGPGRKLEVRYEAPLLAHVTLEPQTCVADVRADGCEIWVPTQAADGTRDTVAGMLGIAPERVVVHTTFLGGGFGRRSSMDFVIEAVQVSKAVAAPVKVMWTREDDLTHDFYRPPSVHHLAGMLDGAGKPLAWLHRLSVPSRSPDRLKNGIDQGAMNGALQNPYTFPNLDVQFAAALTPVPLGPWRSVAHSYNAFAVEGFIDELAHLAGQDPLAFRRQALTGSPRHLRALDLVAEKSGWGKPLPRGRARGLAVHESFGSVVAEVVEVEAESDGSFRIPRVVCAVDCGTVVNPDTVEAQVQGGITFGLSAALHEAITIDGGRVMETSLAAYGPMRMRDAPSVEVHIVRTNEPPGGI